MTTNTEVIRRRLEDHPTEPPRWPDVLPMDDSYELPAWRNGEPLPPGYQAGTYFKSVRTTEDGAEVWTWGRVDPITLEAGWVAGGVRRLS